MPEVTRGPLGLEDLSDSLIVRDVKPGLIEQWGGKAPLTVLTMEHLKGGEKAKGDKTEWTETDKVADWFQINQSGGLSTSGTSLVVEDASHLQGGWTFEFDGELILIYAVNYGTNTLTLQRRIGGTPAASIANRTKVKLGAYQGEQGALAPEAKFKHPVQYENYLAKWERSWEAVETQRLTETYGGDYFTKNEEAKLQEVAEDFERACFRHPGKARLTPGTDLGATDHRRNIMGGLPTFITSNVGSFGGFVSIDAIDLMVTRTMPFRSSDELVLFCGSNIRRSINAKLKKYVQTDMDRDQFGFRIEYLRCTDGQVRLMTAWHCPPDECFGLDLEYIVPKELRPLRIKRNVQAADSDTRKDWALEEKTLRVENERAHFRLTDGWA